jgi:hypothetical protein
MELTSAEIVHAAIDELLVVVGKSAEDLRLFHDVVGKARTEPLPPFQRTTLVVTQRIVEDLKRVESDLRDVLVALGVARQH